MNRRRIALAALLFTGLGIAMAAGGGHEGDGSYFYLKLVGDPVIYTAPQPSSPMPNTGEPLRRCAIDAIGEWIDARALDD